MQRDEKKMVRARKEFYEKSNSNKKLVKAGEITGRDADKVTGDD